MQPLQFARAQMAMSLGFHMIFAAIGIGLPFLMVISEWLALHGKGDHYQELTRKWAKGTGLLFAVGAVSGTALSFELGLLWPRYMAIMGAVVGHLFALEGYAFFIEAIFIGLYLYGWDRLSPRAHWWCGVVIAASGFLSGIFILGVNSWMQLPVGFKIGPQGQTIVTDPIAILKRYGWFVMAVHSTLSCYMAVAFAAAGIYALAWLRGRRDAYVRSALQICLAVGAIGAVLQPLSGDQLAKFVYNTQPAKFAAMEVDFVTATDAPMHIGGVVDETHRTVKDAIRIPGMLSFLAAHDFSARVQGLNDIPRKNWPNVGLTHFAFDAMVSLGMLLMAVGIVFWIMRWRRGVAALQSRWLLWLVLIASPCGFAALEFGWIVTEVGRQPWAINGILRTADAVTTATGISQIFAVFAVVYVLLGATVAMLLYRLSKYGESVYAPQSEPAATPLTQPATH